MILEVDFMPTLDYVADRERIRDTAAHFSRHTGIPDDAPTNPFTQHCMDRLATSPFFAVLERGTLYEHPASCASRN